MVRSIWVYPNDPKIYRNPKANSSCMLLSCSFTGHGVYMTAEGDLFRGSWKDGKQNGRGVYVWADGCIYIGDYVDGYRQGKGYVKWHRNVSFQ